MGSALCRFENAAVLSFDRRFRPFVDRIEGLEMDYLVAFKLTGGLQSSQHREVDRVFVLGS